MMEKTESERLENLTVEGYKYTGVKFSVVEPLKVEPREQGRLDTIELREHALEGGEVHLYLTEENRTWADPGYWYAVWWARSVFGA